MYLAIFRNDSLIASDHHVDETVTFNQDDFPYLTAELGGGVQVTKHRRPIATGTDIGAMSLTKLGSGVASSRLLHVSWRQQSRQ